MSDDLVACPSCGLEVPEGRFCKLCGKPLHEDITADAGKDEGDIALDSALEDLVDIEEDAEKPSPNVILPDFHFIIRGMDQESMAILFAASELRTLDLELDRLIQEISSTRQALDLKHADKDMLVARAENLRKQFEQTKVRRSELRGVQGEIPLKRAITSLEKQTQKLKKLEEVEKKIEESVYEEEKNKILLRIKSFRKDVKSSLRLSKQWLKAMNAEIKNLRKEKSRLDAKLKIGDISQTAYDAKLKEVTNSIGIIEGGKDSLEVIIKMGEKVKT
ncbi:MAG: hypothetical protein ACFFEF_11660 [Candidatus Thorarchaeota archaeon]